MVKLKLNEVVPGLFVEMRALQTKQPVEEVKVEEHDRKMLSIVLSIRVCDELVVEVDLAVRRHIEANKKFGQSCLTAAIAPHQKDHFPGKQGQTHRPYNEIVHFRFATVNMSDIF